MISVLFFIIFIKYFFNASTFWCTFKKRWSETKHTKIVRVFLIFLLETKNGHFIIYHIKHSILYLITLFYMKNKI